MGIDWKTISPEDLEKEISRGNSSQAETARLVLANHYNYLKMMQKDGYEISDLDKKFIIFYLNNYMLASCICYIDRKEDPVRHCPIKKSRLRLGLEKIVRRNG